MPLTFEQFIQRVNNNPRNSQLDEEAVDYLQNGFLYCGKCHTPKEKRLYWFDWGKTPIKCACEKAKEREKLHREYILTHKRK